MGAGVGDIEVARETVEGEPRWPGESVEKGVDDAVRRDAADAFVGGIGNVQVPRRIAGQSHRPIEAGAQRARFIACQEIALAPGEQVETGAVELLDRIAVRNENVAREVDGYVAAGFRPSFDGGLIPAKVGDPQEESGSGIGHIEFADVVDGESNGGGDSRAEGRNDSGGYLADPLVAGIGDVQSARQIDGQPGGILQAGQRRWSSVAEGNGGSRSCVSGEDSLGRTAKDSGRNEIGDIEIARSVNGEITRPRHLGFVRKSGNGRDMAVGGDLAHAMIPEVGDIQVSGEVDGQTIGEVELGQGRQSAVAGEASLARPRDGRDDPFG